MEIYAQSGIQEFKLKSLLSLPQYIHKNVRIFNRSPFATSENGRFTNSCSKTKNILFLSRFSNTFPFLKTKESVFYLRTHICDCFEIYTYASLKGLFLSCKATPSEIRDYFSFFGVWKTLHKILLSPTLWELQIEQGGGFMCFKPISDSWFDTGNRLSFRWWLAEIMAEIHFNDGVTG